MKYTFKRMFGYSLFGGILLSVVVIFILESAIANISAPLISTIFAKDNYEYSISVPDYWDRYYTDVATDMINSDISDKIIYTGNNSEYLILGVSEFPDVYDVQMYKTYAALDVFEKYGMDVVFEYLNYNGKHIYYSQFEISGINHVVGFVENKDFILDFEYKRPSSNNINEGLYTIISSIERFEVKEVDLNGQVNAK